MSTILVDQYGRPLAADPVGPMFGPTRFEDQPAYVRRRGRKGKALSRKRRASSSSSGSRRTSRRSRKGSSRRSARASNRRDYRKFLSKRAGTYGPVAFADQPGWVRKRGRKGKALRRKSAARTTRRSARRSAGSARAAGSTKEVRRLRRAGSITRKQARKLNRQLARTKSKRSAKRTGRKSSRRSSKGLARTGASKVLTYNSLMGQLRKRKGLKAWVCVGKKRTGCGGGRKGYRGSRQLGVLRP